MDQVTRTGKTILCVDNDPGIRELLHEIITHLGHRVITAVDGIDALEKLTDDHFDIVITDISMPRMDGIELIKRIKTDFDDVDVIAITAYEMTYKYTDIIALGASDFISKPFNIDELEAKLNRILRERRLRLGLRRLSTRDGLTGLYNRRYFDDNLIHEASRAFRQNYGLYLLFIDLDGFKAYNDKYGHQQGDKLLRALAEVILDNIRKDVDSACRYGGDEFVIILPHAKRQQALMVAERLLNSFNKRDVSSTGLSIGLAELEGSAETLKENLESLIRKVDQAAYRAKINGGNQVCDEQGQIASPKLSLV
ncbi:MAG: diguanylate cyclase [Deltaproteobacteria bacterium]|nr:MAG: diguanylate cyclase [Deltaproteobacteria bacterium]